MKKSSLLFLFLFLLFFSVLIHANQLKSLVPTLDDRSVTITMTFSSTLSELDYDIQSNPSKTVYSLTLYGVSGKNMNLPLRVGPVEGLWTRDLGDKMSVNVALLIPANKEPEVLLKNNTLILRFWRSAIEVSVDRFSTYSMNLETVLTYLFSDEVLNLSHVITEKVSNLPVTVGFTSSHPEDILRNILVSLGSHIAYAYLTDGTFYIGTPEEVKDVVNRFWKTYIGVDIKIGEDGQNQLEAIRKALPVEAFLEYIPNESTLLAFGDLETHLLLSNLLTSSYIKKEYNVEPSRLPSGERSLEYFYKIASEVNNFLCDGSVKIDSLAEFNKLILAGSAKDVNIIISYLDSYKQSLQKDLEQSKPKVLTVKLPDNFKIVEDVINHGRVESIVPKTETPETTETTATGQSGIARITLAGIIESLLSNYIPEGQLQVDRTFESLGKITLTFPEAMTGIVNEILRDITLRSQSIGYRILRNIASIDTEIIMQIENLTGVIIESLGENNGYIIKGEKNKLDVAEYLISQFTEASRGKTAHRFIDIKSPDSFDSVKNFLEHFFATEGLNPEQYTIDAITEKLVFISAPEEALERALKELGKYEKVFFPDIEERFIEIPEDVYEGGIKDLISTLYTEKIDYTYIPSVGILIARGNRNDLTSLQNLIDQMTPKIESHLGLKTPSTEERKISKLIKSLPGWDEEKFSTYLESYLGEEGYNRIKIIPTIGGYLVIGNESTVKIVEDEIERLRELENPYYVIVERLPRIEQFNDLLLRMGITVEIFPVNSKYILAGTRDNVLQARNLINQIEMGIPAETTDGTTTSTIVFSFIDIPEDSVEAIQTIVTKLGINVEIIQSPTGPLLIGTSNEVKRATEVIESVLSKRREEVEKTVRKGYAILPKLANLDLETVKTIASSFAYNLNIIEAAGTIIVIGTQKDVEDFILVYRELENDGKGKLLTLDKKVPYSELENVIKTLELSVSIVETQHKIIVFGNPDDVAAIQCVVSELTPEEAEPAATNVLPPKKDIAVLTNVNVETDKLSALLNDMSINVKLYSFTNGLAVIGYPEEIQKTKEIVQHLSRLPSLKTSVYKYVETTEPMNQEFLKTAAASLNLRVTFLLVKENGIIVVGSQEDVESMIGFIDGLLSQIKEEEFSYALVRKPGVDVTNLGRIFEGLGLNITVHELPDSLVLIGSRADLQKAQSFLEQMQTSSQESIESTETSYSLITIPEGFTATDIQTILRKIGVNIEIVPAGAAALLVGEENTITNARAIISTLSALGKKPAELVEYSYKVFKRPGQIALTTLQELLASVGLDVKAIEIGNSLVFIGTNANISKAVELLNSLETDAEGDGYQELEYSIVELPESISPDQLEKVLEVLQISARILQLGDFMIVTGDATNLADAERLIKKVVSSAQDTEATTVSDKLSYKLITLPAGSSIDELNSIAETLELKLKIQPIGHQVLIAGDLNEIEYIQNIIEKTSVSEEPEGQRSVKLLQKLPGIDANTLREYLLSKGIPISNIFDVRDGYLIFGNDSAVAQAQQLINYLADSTKRSYEFIVVPENISEEFLKSLADSLTIDIGITRVSETTFLVSGKAEHILKFKETLSSLYSLETDELAYQIVKKPGIQLQQLDEIFNGLGLRVKLLETEQNLIIIGKKTDLAKANKLIEELMSAYNTSAATGTNIAIAELPKLSGWTLEQITEYLKAAEIPLKSLFSYGDKIIGVGFTEQLERAKELLNFLAKDQKIEFTKIEKSLATAEQLQNIADSLDVNVKIIELENAWLLIGNRDALDRIKGIIESSLTEENIYQSYIYNATNVSTELELFIEATFPEVETEIFRDLGIIMLKSRDQEALAKAEELIKRIQSKDVQVSPENNFLVKDGLVYVYAENADLVSIVKSVAKSLGISLMVPEELSETLTLTLEGVTWDTFVTAIQECEPIKIEKVDDIYILRKEEAVPETVTAEATEEQIYRVYHNIEELKTLIEFYGGTVYADSVNGILVVKGLPKSRVMELMDRVSETFTTPKKQVKIETRIVDKSLLDDITQQFGSSLGFEQPNILFTSGSLNLSFSVLDSVDFAKLLKNLVTGSASITAQLESSNVDGSIISNPSIVALSGEEARIHIGDTIPILLKRTDPETGSIVEEIQYLETGVEMTITPTVKDDGTILLDLYIKVSEPQPYANDLYGEKTREAQTKLVIADGNTLTIGGLVSEKENVSVTKLPFFGDLPFIGKFFRSEKTTKEQREMVIFITAKVVAP